MGGDNQYPYSIMAPEPGMATHHRSAAQQSLHHRFYTGRGSSGSVLPIPLPRTPLMQPEGSAKVTLPAAPQEQAPDNPARFDAADPQPPARTRDVPGPRFALRLPVRSLQRAGQSAHPIHGQLRAVMFRPLRDRSGRAEATAITHTIKLKNCLSSHLRILIFYIAGCRSRNQATTISNPMLRLAVRHKRHGIAFLFGLTGNQKVAYCRHGWSDG